MMWQAHIRISVVHFLSVCVFYPFNVIGGNFDPEKFKKLYVDRASKIPQNMLIVKPISSVLGKIKFIGRAFENFKKSLEELEQKSGYG